MSDTAQSNVVNIETQDWSPEQVARWLSGEVGTGNVERVIVAVEYKPDGSPGVDHERMHSKSTCEQCLYLVTWLHRKYVERYFG